jgi:hypothetical protein
VGYAGEGGPLSHNDVAALAGLSLLDENLPFRGNQSNSLYTAHTPYYRRVSCYAYRCRHEFYWKNKLCYKTINNPNMYINRHRIEERNPHAFKNKQPSTYILSNLTAKMEKHFPKLLRLTRTRIFSASDLQINTHLSFTQKHH